MNGSLRFSKTPFVWSFPIRQEILNVSQIRISFHRICSPIFILTWLQQHCRRTFFHSAYCSLSNPICFRSVWCRRTLIPGKTSQALSNSKELSVYMTSGFLFGLQELLQASLCFLRCFIFARIRLDPLSGKVLHHDCISMIVSRFTTFTENFVICCKKITKVFCTRYDSATASSA